MHGNGRGAEDGQSHGSNQGFRNNRHDEGNAGERGGGLDPSRIRPHVFPVPVSSPLGLDRADPLVQRVLPLAFYVLLRGLDATVLKGLQTYGHSHPVHGENPISFCNVFFFAQLAVGLTALLPGRRELVRTLPTLTPADRRLLGTHAFLGMFLGPVAYYQALQSLSVSSQTLLFAMVLPGAALLARWLLREPLPRAFWLSLALIVAGLLLPQITRAAVGGPMDDLQGLAWGLVGVVAFSGAAVAGRSIAGRGWPVALSIGLGSTITALVFAVIALTLFGPHHFLLLQLWWVAGVILIYALSLSLGSELALRLAYRHCSVATVALWGSVTIVVAIASAALLLGEQIQLATVAGIVLLLSGVWLGRRPNQSDPSLWR
jgi:drug/metabolite transporter (DMT)-like permease